MATCTVKITKGRMNGGGCLVMVAVTYEPGNHQDDMAYAIESS